MKETDNKKVTEFIIKSLKKSLQPYDFKQIKSILFHYQNVTGFQKIINSVTVLACKNDKIDLFLFALFDPSLNIKANILLKLTSFMVTAAQHNSCNILQYLLKNPEVKKYTKISFIKRLALEEAFFNTCKEAIIILSKNNTSLSHISQKMMIINENLNSNGANFNLWFIDLKNSQKQNKKLYKNNTKNLTLVQQKIL